MGKWLKNLLGLEYLNGELLDDCFEGEADPERKYKEKFEKELSDLAHQEILYEGRFLVGQIVPLRLRKGNVLESFIQTYLYLDENKENLPTVENYSDWNNFFKQYLLRADKGFLVVGNKPNIIEGDQLQIKTGYNLECGRYLGNYSPLERRKIFESLGMPSINNWDIWVPLLHSYSKISRLFLARFNK